MSVDSDTVPRRHVGAFHLPIAQPIDAAVAKNGLHRLLVPDHLGSLIVVKSPRLAPPTRSIDRQHEPLQNSCSIKVSLRR
ncbi:hypothetical protein HYQ46_008157 [Verticillium longisporum]|nr:hypothetical protein HYQ46_008157 [Verticillium longisporum]